MKQQANILLIEDNEGDIELTRIAFEENGPSCRLSIAHNGAEALDYLFRRGAFHDAVTPDLILLDINMPRMDGLEFLKIVKQDERWKVIPIIMLTSSKAQTDILNCYRLHANCYIMKPSGLQRFADMVRQIEHFWTGVVKLPNLQQA